MISLKNDCVIVSDVHFSKRNDIFIEHLKNIKESEIILNGDIFDWLVSSMKPSVQYNKKLIKIINKLSINKNIIYLEGNHDFDIKSIFPNTTIITREQQPLQCKYQDKILEISHGDKYIDNFLYQSFTYLLRSKFTLYLMILIDILFFEKVFNLIMINQYKKNKCYKIKNFKSKCIDMIKKYKKNTDVIIEGHHHQDVSFDIGNKKYINLGAFCCNKKIYKLIDVI